MPPRPSCSSIRYLPPMTWPGCGNGMDAHSQARAQPCAATTRSHCSRRRSGRSRASRPATRSGCVSRSFPSQDSSSPQEPTARTEAITWRARAERDQSACSTRPGPVALLEQRAADRLCSPRSRAPTARRIVDVRDGAARVDLRPAGIRRCRARARQGTGVADWAQQGRQGRPPPAAGHGESVLSRRRARRRSRRAAPSSARAGRTLRCAALRRRSPRSDHHAGTPAGRG